MRIDAHQHFWRFDPVRDAWIDEQMQVIRRDFLPEDLQSLLAKHDIDGCVAVQADQSEKETEFLLNLAAGHDFIRGVVGWLDLRADNLRERLDYYSKYPLLKGLRHIAQGEADDFLMNKSVQNGIAQLSGYGLTYDILVYAHQLPAAIDLVHHLPDQAFVVDHIAKPRISDGLDDAWKKHMQQLAAYPNVYCKLSGLVTETRNFEWRPEQFQPFLEWILEIFGVDRLMYGSDWPVCLLAAEYEEQLVITQDFISHLSKVEQAKIMGENAIAFYDLDSTT